MCALYLACAGAPGALVGGIVFVAWRVIQRYGALIPHGDSGVPVLLPHDWVAIAVDSITFGVLMPWAFLSLLVFPLVTVWVMRRRMLSSRIQVFGWGCYVGAWLLLVLDPFGLFSWYF